MFFGIGDVYVNLQMGGYPISVNDSEAFSYFAESESTLYVKSMDFEATVKARSRINTPKEYIVSCLFAGLRKACDWDVSNYAKIKLETQLGFKIDDWISTDIAKIVNTEYTPNGEDVDVIVIPVIYSESVAQPTIVADTDGFVTRVTLSVKTSQKDVKVSVPFDAQIYSNNSVECVAFAKDELLQSLYHEHPELSHLWTQIRYNWYQMGPKQQKNPAVQIQMSKSSSNEDLRIWQLPGLNEKVKHPLSGKMVDLRGVIINLNDFHKWPREKIADWLDTLDVDLQFKTKENNEQD